jgi:hypothetical protein
MRSGVRRRPGRQVLHEDVRTLENRAQQRCVVRALDVGHEALLAAIEPDEIAG